MRLLRAERKERHLHVPFFHAQTRLDHDPDESGQGDGEDLQPKVFQDVHTQRNQCSGSVFAMTAGGGLPRRIVRERSQSAIRRAFCGWTRMEVRKARNSSRVTPFSRWPLNA